MKYTDIDGDEALEVIIANWRVAWTIGDEVFIYAGDTDEREDGYHHFGHLGWEETPYSSSSEESYNVDRLRDYVLAKLYPKKLRTNA